MNTETTTASEIDRELVRAHEAAYAGYLREVVASLQGISKTYGVPYSIVLARFMRLKREAK